MTSYSVALGPLYLSVGNITIELPRREWISNSKYMNIPRVDPGG